MTIIVHGNEYVTVAERVAAVNDDPAAEFAIVGGDIITVGTTDRWFYQVTIRVKGRCFIGTAEIKFNAKSGPDATNPFECAETSAIGRALGFAGFGIVEGIASADEMQRSSEPQQPQQQAPRSLRIADRPKPQHSPIVTQDDCADYADAHGIDREAYARAIHKYGSKPEQLMAALELYAERKAAR